jgi:hypothetical protein
VYADTSQQKAVPIPPLVYGYRPDVYVKMVSNEYLLIGEAKTPYDLQSERSINQITGFLKFLNNQKKSSFVLSTRWDYKPYAANLIKRICKSNHFLIDEVEVLGIFK